MKLTLGIVCTKFLLLGFSLVCCFVGLVVYVIGLWLRFDSRLRSIFEQDNNSSTFYTGVYILIGVGALMMLVGFLGCCGAVQNSYRMLAFFFGSLLVILGLDIYAIIWGYLHKEKVIQELQDFYLKTYRNMRDKEDEREILRTIHTALNCCGVAGGVEQFISNICPKNGINNLTLKPCPVAIKEFFNKKFHIIGVMAIGVAIIMILGMILAVFLCYAL